MSFGYPALAREEKTFMRISTSYGKTSFAAIKTQNSYGYSNTANYEPKDLFAVGLEGGYRLGNHFSINTGISWQQYRYTIGERFTPNSAFSYRHVKQGFITIPLCIEYHHKYDGSLSWFAGMGMRYLSEKSLHIDADGYGGQAVDDGSFSKSTFAIEAHGGLYLKVGPGAFLHFGPDLQYNLSDAFMQDDHFVNDKSAHLWQISAKVSFGFFF